LAEISQIHSNSFLLDNNTAAKSAPSTMTAVQTLLNLDDCGYSFFQRLLTLAIVLPGTLVISGISCTLSVG
ncbi:MAG: hypothetical protein ACTTH4_09845, partial [Prevotella denticola]|uniref:hypothetical protein n=1 Tax=Prevotella denticola TaxID=28129 RepID=UPI003FA177CC